MHAAMLLAASALAPQDGGASLGNRLVKLDLLADRAAVRPGETFSVGVRFRIERAWHIYWENHGDSGFPTRATLRGPEGFEIGALRFPGPQRYVEEGDIVTYVHEGEVVLVADVRAPETLPPGAAAAFEVEARWLVCSDVCHAGSGKARIDIPTASADAKSAPANEAAFAAARAKLPRPWEELRGATHEWIHDEEIWTLSVAVPQAKDLELFPLASETMRLESCHIDARGRLIVRFRFRAQSPDDKPRVRAVLRVRGPDAESYFQLDSQPKHS